MQKTDWRHNARLPSPLGNLAGLEIGQATVQVEMLAESWIIGKRALCPWQSLGKLYP